MDKHILVVDDEKSLRLTVSAFIEGAGHKVSMADGFDTANALLDQHTFNTVISDIVMVGKTGIDLLGVAKQKQPDCPFIIVTGYPNLDTATEAIRKNAFDYISKPVYKENLLEVLERALQFNQDCLEQKNMIGVRQEEINTLSQTVDEQAEEIKLAYEKLKTTDLNETERLRHVIREELQQSNENNIQEAQLPQHGLNLEQHINDIVRQALELNSHNKTKTARYLGITRDVLRSRLKNLEKED